MDDLTPQNRSVAERAGNSAINGSADIKAGRFDQDFQDFQNVVYLLARDAEQTYHAWVAWDVLSRDDARLAGVQPRSFVQHAMLRDAVYSCLRLTEPLNSHLPSLGTIAQWLVDPENRRAICDRQWAMDLGYSGPQATVQATLNRERASLFDAHFVRSPAGSPCLATQTELAALREALLELASTHFSYLAPLHPLRAARLAQIKRCVEIVVDLACAGQGIFMAGDVTGEDYRQAARGFVTDWVDHLPK
jgi:hypothetical protein